VSFKKLLTYLIELFITLRRLAYYLINNGVTSGSVLGCFQRQRMIRRDDRFLDGFL
jgi:hypothetical protein